MLTRQGHIKCDECGKWIKLDDIDSGKAGHKLLTPDSDLSIETYESICADCKAKQ